MADSLEDDYFQTAEEFLSDVEGSDGGGEVQWDEDLDGDADISAPKAVAGSKRKASAADDLSEREDESDDEEVGGAAGMTVGAGGGGGRELTAEEKKKEKKKRNKEKLKEKKVSNRTVWRLNLAGLEELNVNAGGRRQEEGS